MARGADTTSWTRPTRPVPGHRRGEAAAARVVAGTTRDRSRSRSHRRDRRSRSPRRDQRQAFSPPGFPSVLIDLRPEQPGPVFLEPDPEPEVREDLIDRKDFSDKLQAVLTLAPFVGFCFLEIGYLNGRRAIERGRLSTGGALRIDLDPPTSTSAGSRLR